MDINPPGRAIVKLLPIAMLVGTAGMMAFMWVEFRGNPTYLVFGGGMMALSALGMLVGLRKPSRGVGLLLGVASFGMAVFIVIAFRDNPTYLIFGVMMALSTCVMVFRGLRASRNAGSTEDEAKR